MQRLHSFGLPGAANPRGSLLQGKDGALYGTTFNGGTYGYGTVFKMFSDGTGYTVLHSFSYSSVDGGSPYAGLVQGSDGALYGTTGGGGPYDYGTVFKVATNGADYSLLHGFAVGGSGGASPYAGLVQGSDGLLYGTTSAGGTYGNGVVFRLGTNGAGFTVLHEFSGINNGTYAPSRLVQGSDGVLYGTTQYGGLYANGTVFRLATNGAGYRVLYSFSGSGGDGANPQTGLVQGSDSALYGTTASGGTGPWSGGYGCGTVFKIATDGTGYSVLYSFGSSGGDGAAPAAGLVQGTDGALYGTTGFGGTYMNGCVFKLNIDGTGYTRLYHFIGSGGDGAASVAALVQASDGALYGTTYSGGTNDNGTVFKLSIDGASYSVVYRFTGTGGDGANPQAGLIQGADGALYGTTVDNSGPPGSTTVGYGTVFKVNIDGRGYTVLYSFTGSGGDGANPQGALTQGSDGALYGTTFGGGAYTNGTVFRLETNGTGYAVLYSFNGSGGDGDNPQAGLVQGRDGALYGTTSGGGSYGDGTVFKLNTDGTGYAVLLSFKGPGVWIGASALIQGSDGLLYGTTSAGGANGYGSVFKMDTNGAGYSLLYSFLSGGDGLAPQAGLVQGADDALYGTTSDGGTNGGGTVFKVNIDGTGYSVLYAFVQGTEYGDGFRPLAGLVQGRDGELYGTTYIGGTNGDGTVFKLNTDGTGYRVIYNFTSSGGDGAQPWAGLVQGSDGAFYGTTRGGGDQGFGTLFRLGPVPPPLFTQIVRLPDRDVQLALSGAPYVTWRVEVATNLSPPFAWMTLTSVAPTNGTAQFSDLNATNSPSRAYRVVWP